MSEEMKFEPFYGELERQAMKARFEKFLDEQVKKCPKCQTSPVIFIIDKRDQEKIGLCDEHWNKLNDLDFEV